MRLRKIFHELSFVKIYQNIVEKSKRNLPKKNLQKTIQLTLDYPMDKIKKVSKPHN